jgi:CrcB protein
MVGSLSARRRLAAVFAGGFCGTLARYGLSTLLEGWLGKGWPYDILLINLTGALLLAGITALADATFLIGPTRRLFLNVGFLGAYTTFSTLALGDMQMFTGGKSLLALLYLILSLAGGIGAVILGDWLSNQVVKRVRYYAQHVRGTRRLTETLAEQQREGQVMNQTHQEKEAHAFLTEREGECEALRKMD